MAATHPGNSSDAKNWFCAIYTPDSTLSLDIRDRLQKMGITSPTAATVSAAATCVLRHRLVHNTFTGRHYLSLQFD
jgi:hypothetical protein